MKQWPVFFLLIAFAISPLFMGEQNDIIACIHILVLAVFLKEFLSSYQEFRIPYNSLTISICLFYIWMALSISWSPSPVISLHTFVWLSIFPLCFFTYSIKQSLAWSTLAKGAVILTLFIAFIGIIQRLFSVPPPTSFFQEKNTFAALMNLFALPVTAYFITPQETNNKLSKLCRERLENSAPDVHVFWHFNVFLAPWRDLSHQVSKTLLVCCNRSGI